MTILDNETDIIESLDFEFEPPCESQLGCDRAAEWKFVLLCCGDTTLLCDPCRIYQLDWNEKVKLVYSSIKCTSCGTVWLVTEKISEFVPL